VSEKEGRYSSAIADCKNGLSLDPVAFHELWGAGFSAPAELPVQSTLLNNISTPESKSTQ
jgi:hypothetical protein